MLKGGLAGRLMLLGWDDHPWPCSLDVPNPLAVHTFVPRHHAFAFVGANGHGLGAKAIAVRA